MQTHYLRRLNCFMKRHILTIKQFLKRYRVLSFRLNHILDFKTMILYLLQSILLAALIYLLPVLLLINLFIYTKLHLFLSILLLLLTISWPFVLNFFYYRLLSLKITAVRNLNTRVLYLVESSFISLIITIFGIILLTVIF